MQVTSASLSEAQLRLDRTAIKAPFTGRILRVSGEIGEYVQPGRELAHFWDISALEVPVSLPANDLQQLLPRDASEELQQWLAGRLVITDRVPDWVPRAHVSLEFGEAIMEWNGFVRALEGRIDPQTRTIPLVIEVPDPWPDNEPDQRIPLLPGMFCRVSIEGPVMPGIFVLPRSAVQIDGTVWVVEEARLRRKSVRILRQEKQVAYATPAAYTSSPANGDDGTSATRPLSPGDAIVVSQLVTPTDGMSVRTEDSSSTSSAAKASAGPA
jgi:membrane fusion protein, multidrug efflux system